MFRYNSTVTVLNGKEVVLEIGKIINTFDFYKTEFYKKIKNSKNEYSVVVSGIFLQSILQVKLV